jgi:hypothetical protein
MANILEELQSRASAALKRLQEAQAQFQAAQQKLAVAQQEHTAWATALNFEARRQQQERQQQEQKDLTPPSQPVVPPETATPQLAAPDINKTDLIKQALARHSGATPAELYKDVQQHVTKAYLYAVLSRLNRNKSVKVKARKYYLQSVAKVEEVKPEQNPIVQ